MRKMLKKIVAPLMALTLVFSMSTVSFAATNDINEAKALVDALVEEEGGTPIAINSEIVPEDGIVSPQYTVVRPIEGGTTTGYLSSSFTVPSNLSNTLIKVAWVLRPYNSSANSNAVLKMVVKNSSGSTVATLYLPISQGATPYSIATLPSGTYTYNITPYSNVSGTYVYAMEIYSF